MSDVSDHASSRSQPRNNYAFIDGQNVNLTIRAQGCALDFRRLRRYLADKYHVTKAFLFVDYIPDNRGLSTALQQQEYICANFLSGERLLDSIRSSDTLKVCIAAYSP